ncbi:hypothetical protein [Feifania hominis]|uniref:hypothetical protein n=1 Tax=Feifania hominis TaxID=2763660 RepID=UPI0020168762|nr:hypothetical protein [Feifania hominis]
MIFSDNPLISGTSITHAAGTADIQINRPGIYEVIFHGVAGLGVGTSIPATLSLRLYQNGVPVTGAITAHTFTATAETATVMFAVPLRADGPATLQIRTSAAGFTLREISASVMRLGDAT